MARRSYYMTGSFDTTPWLTYRQCRRKEKGPIAPSSFYHASKLTTEWSESVILESTHAGGYTVSVDSKLCPTNREFPIRDKEWRGPVPVADLTSVFPQVASQPFSLTQARRAAHAGDDLINQTGALYRALRSVQACKMSAQAHLAQQSNLHLGADPDLRGDICELHRSGATPKFRGPPPWNIPGTGAAS